MCQTELRRSERQSDRMSKITTA